MIERNKITISFLPGDNDLWNFLQSKKETCNVSEYIRNLIRQDMDNRSSYLNEDKIVDRIVKLLQSSEIALPENKQKAKEAIPLSDEAKNTIISLF